MATSYYDATSINSSNIHLKLSQLQELSIEEFQLNFFESLLKDVERELICFRCFKKLNKRKQKKMMTSMKMKMKMMDSMWMDCQEEEQEVMEEEGSKKVGGKSKCSSSRQVDDENDDDLDVAASLKANRNRQAKLLVPVRPGN